MMKYKLIFAMCCVLVSNGYAQALSCDAKWSIPFTSNKVDHKSILMIDVTEEVNILVQEDIVQDFPEPVSVTAKFTRRDGTEFEVDLKTRQPVIRSAKKMSIELQGPNLREQAGVTLRSQGCVGVSN